MAGVARFIGGIGARMPLPRIVQRKPYRTPRAKYRGKFLNPACPDTIGDLSGDAPPTQGWLFHAYGCSNQWC